jgi:hypothetical protein
VVPAMTPREGIDRLHGEINAAVQSP